MHPRSSGQGLFPRYGGGWMHQFGHVYALQQELLNRDACNWFRAVELWHCARQEGVAMNVMHFNTILRQCVPPAVWEQSLKVLEQMQRERIRPDVVGVGSVLATCAEARRPQEVETVFNHFQKAVLLDSVCHLARIRARAESGDAAGAVAAGKDQAAAGIPFLPYTFTCLLEACEVADDGDYALELVQRMRSESWQPAKRDRQALQKIAARHPLVDWGRYLSAEEDTTTSLRLASKTPQLPGQ